MLIRRQFVDSVAHPSQSRTYMRQRSRPSVTTIAGLTCPDVQPARLIAGKRCEADERIHNPAVRWSILEKSSGIRRVADCQTAKSSS